TTAFLAWLAAVFVWFALTVLRGRREQFAYGAVVAGFGAVLLLNAVNPDALIVRTNVAQAHGDGTFDGSYATSLSADAVPALVAALPRLGRRDRCTVAGHLVSEWSQPDADLRAWSV